jgi:DNA-binding transcriptional LysR family regulator
MSCKGVVVASPAYLKRHGQPTTLEDLAHHDILTYSLMPAPNIWEFKKDGKQSSVKFNPRLSCDSAELEAAMAIKGIGITRLPLFCCQQAIDKGELKIILDDYDQHELGMYAVFPHRQYLTAKVRAFVDFLVDQFATKEPALPELKQFHTDISNSHL